MIRASLCSVALIAAACSAPPSAPPESPPDTPNNAPLVALRVTGSGQEGPFPIAQFSAEGTRDPDGDSLYYTWDFGDGTSLTTTYTRQNHAYLDDGRYTVVLTVTDTRAQTSATAEVYVDNATPMITALELSTPRLPASIPVTAVVHARVADQGPLDNPVLSIDWGDGTVSTDTIHVYQLPGIYQAKFWATDKDGASSQVWSVYSIWAYDPAVSYQVPGYDIIDVGTLGGDWTLPIALNNRGDVIGSSNTASDSAHAFLWREGQLVDLNPPGNDVRYARVITDAGLIAGVASGGSGELPLWRDGTFTGFVPVPKSEYGAWPVRISESGDVLLNVEGHEFPDATLIRDGTAIRLVSGTHAGATDMNSQQQIIGWVGLKFIGESVAESHGFLWDDGVFKDLGSIGTETCWWNDSQCGFSDAYDINDQGQIVGSSFDGQVSRAVLWDAKELVAHDLGFGTGASRAVAINENGQIAGDSHDGQAYFRDNGTVTSIGSLGGASITVTDMNEHGAVVGSGVTPAGIVHAFVWTRSGGMRDLGGGPYGGPGVGTVAVAINDRGDILGYTLPCAKNYDGRCSEWRPMRALLWRSRTPAAVD